MENIKEKELLELLDSCTGYALRKAYDGVHKTISDKLFAKEYALIYCFFDTLEHYFLTKKMEKENESK